MHERNDVTEKKHLFSSWPYHSICCHLPFWREMAVHTYAKVNSPTCVVNLVFSINPKGQTHYLNDTNYKSSILR